VAAFVAAFANLHIALGHTGAERELGRWSWDYRTIRGTGKRLAVGAMTNEYCVRINLRLKGDLSAMAASVNLHATSPRLSGTRQERYAVTK
jgi:hypothetical protein